MAKSKQATEARPTETHTAEEMEALLDEQLVTAMRDGVPAIDYSGKVVTDAEGKPVMKPPPSMILEIARKRLKEKRAARPTAPEEALHAAAKARFERVQKAMAAPAPGDEDAPGEAGEDGSDGE